MVSCETPLCRLSIGKCQLSVVIAKIGEVVVSYRNWAIMRPVGPAPIRRACEPALGAIFSRPCMAHEAGSIRVASISLMFLILKRRPWVYEHCIVR